MKRRRRDPGSSAGTPPGKAGPTAGLRGVACVVALALLAGLVRPALAAEDDAEQARLHLRRAAAATDLGNHTEAAKEYEAAYIKTSDANLLAQVGQAWQLAGDRNKALTAFRSCVRLAANGDHRTLCEARLRELEYSAAAGPAMPGQAPMGVMPLATPPPPAYVAPPMPATTVVTCEPCARVPAEPSAASGNPALWIVLGAVVIAGAVLGIVYLGRDKDLAMPTTTFGAKEF